MSRLRQLFSPLALRDFRLLWFAQVASELGDWAGRLALAVVVAERTHSAALTALVTTASVLPYIGIGQVLATRVNRYSRRRTIVVADLGRALIFACLVLRMPPWALLLLAFAAGCLTPPFEAARNSLTPLSVPEDAYGDAIALASITFDLAVLFGYAIGGALVAIVGARVALLVNAASFAVSAALLTRLEIARQVPDRAAEVRLRDGWHALVDDPFVRRFFVGYAVAGACAVVGESLVAVYALQVLHDQAGVSGVLAAAIPAGAVVATIAARPIGNDTEKLRRASEVALVGSLLAFVLLLVQPHLGVALLAFASLGMLNASRVPANEVAVMRVADHLRGPTFTIMNGFLLGGQAAAAAIGGVTARSAGVRQTIAVAMLIAAAVALWGVLRPPHELRHARTVR